MNKSGMDIEKKNDWQGLNFKEFIYIQQESTKPNFFYIIFFIKRKQVDYYHLFCSRYCRIVDLVLHIILRLKKDF